MCSNYGTVSPSDRSDSGIVAAQYICPESKPVCNNYEFNVKWGECAEGSIPLPDGITQYSIESTTTWQQAQDKCDSYGKELCSREKICPDGKLKAPIGGINKDTWVPTSESSNTWTSVGNYDPIAPCRIHQDFVLAIASTRTTNGTYRSRIF